MKGSSENLIKLSNILKSKICCGKKMKYYIPTLYGIHKELIEETLVNPYEFYWDLIENYILPNKKDGINYNQSISKILHEEDNGEWIYRENIYSINIRSSTAYYYDKSNLENGTFLKTLSIIPLLKKMNITTVYILPIFEIGDKSKKGEMGSLYAIKDFYSLNSQLKDKLVLEMTIEEEFKALVEAFHIMGIRVIIDIVTRTMSRDSKLIYNHPDWFYWIGKEEENFYSSPFIEGISKNEKPTIENMKIVYSDKNINEHINKFRYAPNIANNSKYIDIKKISNSNNILNEIEKRFNITTAPAFSDCINDIQPAWKDVTYLRLYLDNPTETAEFSKFYKIPYVLFDTIKCDRFKGKIENENLWNYLSDIIPYYENMYGIDGARIDMGHALPKKLLKNIIEKSRKNDKSFALIAEELEFDRVSEVYNNNFNVIMGASFVYEQGALEYSLYNLLNIVKTLPIKCLAAAETPDTNRIINKYGGKKLLKLLLMFNFFLPKGIPFINSGMELCEKQPMNLGLECTEEDRYMHLSKEDDMYSKLSFFDNYKLHWESQDSIELIDYIKEISETRNKYFDTLNNINNFYQVEISNKKIIIITYIINNKKYNINNNILFIIMNSSMDTIEHGIVYMDYLRKESWNSSRKADIIYSNEKIENNSIEFDEKWNMKIKLFPGECKIVIL